MTYRQSTLLINWDVRNDEELWRYRDVRDDRAFGNPVFSTDGRFVVVPSRKVRTSRLEDRTLVHNELHVLDGKTGKILRTFTPDGASNIDNMVFPPTAPHVSVIVTRRVDGEPARFQVVQWNVETGEEIFAVDVDDESPNLVGYAAQGNELMVAQRVAGGVLVLDAGTGTPRRVIAPEGTLLNQHGKWSLSPDGRTLAVLGLQRLANEVAVAFYDAASGEPGLRIPVDTDYPPLAMTWSSDGSRLALVSAQDINSEVAIRDTATGRLLLSLSRKGLVDGNPRSLRFSPENHLLLHIAGDNRVEQGSYDNPSLHPIQIWDGTPGPTDGD